MLPMKQTALETYRQAHGLTLRKMAAITKALSHQTLFLHCRGLQKISAETAVVYHKAFGIPLSDLRPDLWPPEGEQQPYRQDGGGA